MQRKFLRTERSVLEDSTGDQLVFLNGDLMEIILNNEEFKKRCLAKVYEGKNAFEKRLEKASIGFFSQEEMANWLNSIKEDAQLETSRIAIIHEARFGAQSHASIDFERVGFLSGIYQAANWYLNEIAASTPLNKEKAHYSIYDHLEQLDELYIKTDSLPGYYQMQKDKKVKKQVFELENLGEYWQEILELNKQYETTRDFGDKYYLLNLYHNSFLQKILAIHPRSEIKLFLDFHFFKYRGLPLDFLNHIEFRVLDELGSIAGKEWLILRQLIKEWISEKKFELSKEDETYLFKKLVSACATFIDGLTVYKPLQDENKYNTVIKGFLQHAILDKGWFINDQSQGGFTDSESKAFSAGIASRDMVIVNAEQQLFSAIEFFRLQYIPKSVETYSVLSNHLTKIFRNEITGVSPLFMVIYCERKNFAESWKKYFDYLKQFDFGDYPLKQLKKDGTINPKRTSLKIAISEHERAGSVINLYHLFLDLNP